MEKIYFITGIDTDAGKSISTGVMALYLKNKGINVITQKMAQTGCVGISEDIATHRNIMGIGLLPEDVQGLTCPYIFSFPASPDFSASLEGKEINVNEIIDATNFLSGKYDVVLVEGVGGIMVPLNESVTVADYLVRTSYPAIIVASAKLGSINHTLMTLEVCRNRNIKVTGLIYNKYIRTNPEITDASAESLKKYLSCYYPEAGFVELDEWETGCQPPDMSAALERIQKS